MDTSLEKRVGKNSLAIYVGRLANLGINLVAFVFLANYLGESLYGRLSFVLTYVGFFDIVVNAGCNQILVRELARAELRRERVLGTGLWLRAASLGVGVVACWVGIVALGYPKEVVYLVLIVSLNLLLSSRIASARSFFEAVFQAELRMMFPMALVLLDNLVFLILVLWGSRRGAGIVEIAFFYTLSNLGGFLLLAWRFFRDNPISWHFDRELARSLLVQSVPVMLYLCFSNLNTRLDVLLVSLLRGDAEVGLYTSATRLVLPLTLLSTPITMSLYPIYSRAYRSDPQLFADVLSTGLKLLALLGLALACGFFFNGEWVYRLLYRPEYAPAARAFSLIMAALALMFVTFYMVEILIGTNRQHLATIVMMIVLISNVALNLVLVRRFGFAGAAYARLATALLSSSVLTYLVQRHTRGHLLRDWPRVAAVVVIAWGVSIAVRPMSPPLQWPILGASIAASVVLTGYFRPWERALLLRFIGKSR